MNDDFKTVMWFRIRIRTDPPYGRPPGSGSRRKIIAENYPKKYQIFKKIVFKFKIYIIRSNTVKTIQQFLYFQANFVSFFYFHVVFYPMDPDPHLILDPDPYRSRILICITIHITASNNKHFFPISDQK